MTPTTLPAGPLRIVKAARSQGYCLRVAEYDVVTPATVTQKGDPVPERTMRHLDVRGWRRGDGRRFAVRWKQGKADVAYWWTRVHYCHLTEPDEHRVWATEDRYARRVGVTDLAFLIKEMR